MPGFLDYLRQRKPQPVAPTTQTVATPQGIPYDPIYGPTTEQIMAGYAALQNQLTQGQITSQQYDEAAAQLGASNRAIIAGQMSTINSEWERDKQLLASGQMSQEEYNRRWSSFSGYNPTAYQNAPVGGSYPRTTEDAPPRTDRPLDIYNPGPYLADILRKQLPGYVFGTKVPKPSQVTLSEFLRLLPTEREQVLPAYVSALGIEPADFFSEMQSFWLNGGPYRRVAWGS